MINWYSVKERIPHKSGVYIFKDELNSVLYVGKAIDLYHRVASYFLKSQSIPKTSVLVEKIARIETIIVESELEALILEANLIKKYLPPFNVRLTDDKDYLYIAVTKEIFPKVITLRKKDLKKAKKFFGPFPSSRTVRNTLKTLRRVFPWCQAPRSGLSRLKPCFYYHIGLCLGACAGLISKEDYSRIIRSFSKFLDGKKEELVGELTADMKKSADLQKFEDAAKIKKMIEGINYLTQVNRIHLYLENPNFLEQETKLALSKLKEDLNMLRLPERIEAYDISNTGGRDATGSMVVLTLGEIDKSQYRKFKIHISGRPNDVGMHKEMMRRRIRHKEWPIPDLILIDGGKGQVAGVSTVISGSVYKNIPVYGLAKRMEWLYQVQGEMIKLPKKSLSLKLLQKIRDEAHRFAITYHRKLRANSAFNMI